ncbi:hypothetical protein SASPL_137527 [Salvia splendens]|uniref:Uncharacterized protein n=1 Tax=Salvia splendens TaxID=180675 RepID=A0A8X8WUI8_SALSN|nr:hypothetical protein SASPL_137527 [Salvia splendens]
MDESEQQHYVDFYSGSRHRRTSWDQPSRTSGCRVGEIRAPPLPKPPPQPVPEPELFYGPTHRGTSDTPASKHTTRPSFGPRGFLHADSDVPSRFPPSAYTGQQREQSQTRNRHLHPTFPSPRTPAHPQHVLDQQPQPSRHRAAPPPPLHMDQQRSSSCGHPTTHLRQATAYLELPTTVKQPLLQRPPSCLRSPSLHSATKLVSCEEKYLESDAKVLNQVDLRLNEKKLVDDEVRAIENVRKSAIRGLSFENVEGSITLSLREVSNPASLRRTSAMDSNRAKRRSFSKSNLIKSLYRAAKPSTGAANSSPAPSPYEFGVANPAVGFIIVNQEQAYPQPAPKVSFVVAERNRGRTENFYAAAADEGVDAKAAKYISTVQERFRLERVNSERKNYQDILV